jgi:trafficking protein particle complex subunit 8
MNLLLLSVPSSYLFGDYCLTALSPPCRDLIPPSWIGRLTFRGTLEPMQHVILTPTLLVTGPNTYALEGWQLGVEVGQQTDQGWRTFYHYLEKPPKTHRPCVTVVATNTSP